MKVTAIYKGSANDHDYERQFSYNMKCKIVNYNEENSSQHLTGIEVRVRNCKPRIYPSLFDFLNDWQVVKTTNS